MTQIYLKQPFLLGFLGGMFAMLLLLASSPVSFQFYSHGHGQIRSLSLNSGTYQISMKGFVPIVCRVSIDDSVKATGDNIIDLGQMNEFCNNANGYRIFVDHASDASGAALIIDGQRVELSAQGSTVIYQSNTAAKRSHRISLDVTQHKGPIGSLWFRIQPL